MAGFDVAKMRIDHGISQSEFAKRLDMSRSQVSRIENDKLEVDDYTLEKMCDVFSVSKEVMKGVIDRPKNTSGNVNIDEKIDSKIDEASSKLYEKIRELEERDLVQERRLKLIITGVVIVFVLLTSILVAIVLDRKTDNKGFAKTENCQTDFDHGKSFGYEHGRIYCDASYYKTVDGKSYIAVSVQDMDYHIEDRADHVDYFIKLTDAQVNNLKEGDQITLDRDTTITVGNIVTYDEWEDPQLRYDVDFTEDGNKVDYRRKGGLVSLGNGYYLAHPNIDGRYWTDDSNLDLWVVYTADSINRALWGVLDIYKPYNRHDWVQVADDAEIVVEEPTIELDGFVEKERASIYDAPAILRKYLPEDRQYCEVYFEFISGRIVTVNVLLDSLDSNY